MAAPALLALVAILLYRLDLRLARPQETKLPAFADEVFGPPADLDGATRALPRGE